MPFSYKYKYTLTYTHGIAHRQSSRFISLTDVIGDGTVVPSTRFVLFDLCQNELKPFSTIDFRGIHHRQ